MKTINLEDQITNTDTDVAAAEQNASPPTEEVLPDTPPSIDASALDGVSGGAGPKYLANHDELVRRSHMTREQLAETDAAWAKTFASLSPERKAAIRKQAALNAAHMKPHTEDD